MNDNQPLFKQRMQNVPWGGANNDKQLFETMLKVLYEVGRVNNKPLFKPLFKTERGNE